MSMNKAEELESAPLMKKAKKHRKIASNTHTHVINTKTAESIRRNFAFLSALFGIHKPFLQIRIAAHLFKHHISPHPCIFAFRYYSWLRDFLYCIFISGAW
jgi:hypothetical protein